MTDGFLDPILRDSDRNPIIDGAPYRQASKISELIDDKYGLHIWRTRRAMSGVAHNEEIRAKVLKLDPANKEGWGWYQSDLIEQAAQAAPKKGGGFGSGAAAKGTRIHAAIDHFNKGKDYNQDFAGDVDTFTRLLDKAGMSVVDSEQFVALHKYRVAGSYDVKLRVTEPITIKGGILLPGDYIGDVKTGKDVTKNGLGIAMQLAVYANGELFPSRVAQDVNTEIGLVLHMPAGLGTATLYTVDLIRGLEAVRIAVEADEMRKAKKMIVAGMTL